MATNEIITKLNELADLRKMAEDLNAEIEAIQDEIKAHMTEAETDTITAGAFKVTWKAVTSTRIDTTALRGTVKLYAQNSMQAAEKRVVMQ